MTNPSKDELELSPPAKLTRIAIEGIGERDQVWVYATHHDGTKAIYFNYLDEDYTVVRSQQALLQAALVHRLDVVFHYRQLSIGNRFHACTAIHPED